LNGMRPEVSPDFEDYKHYKYYYSYGEDGKKRRKKKSPTLYDTGDIHLRTLEAASSARLAQWARKGWRNWKKRLGLPLLALACVLLAGGLLWQNNMLGASKMGHSVSPNSKEDMKTPLIEQALRDSPQKEPSVPPTPKRPDANSFEARRIASEALPTPFHQPEKTSPAVPEEKDFIAAVHGKDEVVSPPATIPQTETKDESPQIPTYGESVTRQGSGMPLEKIMDDPTAPPLARRTRKTYYPYSLLVSSVPDLRFAEETVLQWGKRGLAAYYVRVVFSQGEQYWIYTGCFESRERAEAFKAQKDIPGATLKKTPYANMVGVYESLEELQSQNERLKELGYSSYAVAEPQGKYALFVGAFLQKERARQQHEELKAKGVENQIVKR